MSSPRAHLDDPPAKGTMEGEFFHREESLFAKLFSATELTIVEGEEELETNVFRHSLACPDDRIYNSRL